MTHRPFTSELDHIVVAAATLEDGEAFIAARTGATPQRGGKHVTMGTHNSLLRLGERTDLEITPSIPTRSAVAAAMVRATGRRCAPRSTRHRGSSPGRRAAATSMRRAACAGEAASIPPSAAHVAR
jgi:hypothetical protein